MGWMPAPDGIEMCQSDVGERHLKEKASMDEVTIVGLDLAKRVFQLHGARQDGGVGFRRKLPRGQLLTFLAKLPRCIVAMEACATAHYWAREIAAVGHGVRLVPPAYVKPFVKRQKNDAADAEAIAEAASRPTMRFVEPKTEHQQARAMVFRTRDMFVRQRTQMVNALRAHLAEHGLIAAKGIGNVQELRRIIETAETGIDGLIIETAHLYLEQIEQVSSHISKLEKALKAEADHSDRSKRLMTMPGVGPVTAMAIEAFAPSLSVFRRGRDFAAWLGLVPKQNSSGGKQVLGHTSKMGQRDIRRLLIIGAMSVIRWFSRNTPEADTWLGRLLRRKPRQLAAIALANKMARSLWAMETRQETFRDPRLVAA
jgi:transposase